MVWAASGPGGFESGGWPEGLASAFLYFEGVARRLVLDNIAAAVLGRIGPGRNPLWHDTFRAFARLYGIDPFACRVRDPDRKG